MESRSSSTRSTTARGSQGRVSDAADGSTEESASGMSPKRTATRTCTRWLPTAVIARAKEILARLEGSQVKLETAGSDASAQMALFGLPDDRLRKRLGALETSNMTPIEALNILHQLSEEAKKPQ